MSGPKITTKVCGVCRPQDARDAVAAGADAIGVILAPSRRQVTLEEAEAIFTEVSPGVARVGVFVDADPAFIEEAATRLGLDYVQFHGSETPELCATASTPVIKAFKVGRTFQAADVDPYRRVVAYALLDTLVEGADGGSGLTFDWGAVGPLPAGVPVIAAGGLDPGNVASAIAALHPAAVDVSSGVEVRLREKDPDKLRAFCEAVRAANHKETIP